MRSILLKVKTLLLQRCALCIKFHVTEGHKHVIGLGVTEGPNVRDQIVFCAFYTILMEVQINAGYIHATHASVSYTHLTLPTSDLV